MSCEGEKGGREKGGQSIISLLKRRNKTVPENFSLSEFLWRLPARKHTRISYNPCRESIYEPNAPWKSTQSLVIQTLGGPGGACPPSVLCVRTEDALQDTQSQGFWKQTKWQSGEGPCQRAHYWLCKYQSYGVKVRLCPCLSWPGALQSLLP